MEKVINGIAVELVKGLDCRECVFHTNRNRERSCSTMDNSCLDIYRGGWRRVETPEVEGIVNEDPLY